LLYIVRKEIIIKSIAKAIPRYTIYCFYLTKSFCDQVRAMIYSYW
jgi:hypothetical protein